MKLGKLFAAASLAVLSGCVTAPEPKTPFNPAEAAFIHKQGNNTINGQAFLRRNDGIVVYGAGSDVYLIPKTAYSTERLDAVYQGRNINSYMQSPPSPPGYEQAMRKTKANGEGRFTFDHVADGSYYIVTDVRWMVGYASQGGNLRASVTVSGGSQTEVILDGS